MPPRQWELPIPKGLHMGNSVSIDSPLGGRTMPSQPVAELGERVGGDGAIGAGAAAYALHAQTVTVLVRQSRAIRGILGGKSFAFNMEFDPGLEADRIHLRYLDDGVLFEPEISAVFGR